MPGTQAHPFSLGPEWEGSTLPGMDSKPTSLLALLLLFAPALPMGAQVEEPSAVPEASGPPHYKTIDESIARGDLADVHRHIVASPESVNTGKNPTLSPLQQAILRNKTEIAVVLLEAKADPNQVDASKRTLVHLAVERGNAALIPVLLEYKSDPDQLDKDGWTPLHHAAAKNKVEVAKALLEGGANPKIRSERGGTPLHEGAASGSKEMILLLLKFKIDPNVVSKTGVTALDVARQSKNAEAIEILSAQKK